MGTHGKTLALIAEAHDILSEHNPMTLRQLYYQLVARQVIKNTLNRYKALSRVISDARWDGLIPWEWIEDRLRRPRHVSMWNDLADFGRDVVRAYRRDVWASQSGRVEAWCEKDALSGIFEDALEPYGVTLSVGRGYDSTTSVKSAADRFGDGDGVTVLYFGDFDPSGWDMTRSLTERLAWFGCEPEVVRCALTPDDIARHNLPPDFTKVTDTRRARFVARHGDVSVELDALPVDVLRDRIVTEVEARIDLDALAEVKHIEAGERAKLARALGGKGKR